MRVKLLARAMGRRLYEVCEANGPKWWTANHDVKADTWYVCNSKSTALQEYGKLWCRIVDACEAFAKEQEL